MKQASMDSSQRNRGTSPQGTIRPVHGGPVPYWDQTWVKRLLRTPYQLAQDPTWVDWVQQHGGIAGIQDYLRRLPLSKDECFLLQLLLERPREVADTYAGVLQVSRATYFYRLQHLLDLLAGYLNTWELHPKQSHPEIHPEQLNERVAVAFSPRALPASPQEPAQPQSRAIITKLHYLTPHLNQADAALEDQAESTDHSQSYPASESSDLLLSTDSVPLIERDSALQTIQRFLTGCLLHSRSVLHIEGCGGSGRSRLLAEAAQLAQLQGALVIQIEEAALWIDLLSALLMHDDHAHPIGHAPFAADRSDIDQILEQLQADRLLILCVDNLPALPTEAIGMIRQALQTPLIARLGLIYTSDLDDLDVLATPFQEHLQLPPLSLQGIGQWISSVLGWCPEPDVLAWFHNETRGLPARIEQGLNYLIVQGAIQHTKKGWRCGKEAIARSLSPYLRQDSCLPPHNLPRFSTSFIGRIQEATTIARLLKSSRLVTLVGLGGIGKTRLAVHVAKLMRRHFVHGVYLVSLSTITDPQQLLPSIAQALGIKDEGHMPLAEYVARSLANKHLLLVLDNAEHVLSHIDYLRTLLEQTRHLRILVTSREQLRVGGETVFVLNGLSLAVDANAASEVTDAVLLFMHRGQAADPDFRLSDDLAPAVAQICRLVQGMPLAIELAAAWVRLLSCSEIAARITANIDFLVTRLRNVPERHRSLRAVFDHSWQLLSPNQQDGFQRLAVFRGGFGHAAATAVGVSLPLLSDLLDMSLIRRTQTDRYELHELLRQYAAEHLAAWPEIQQQTYERHANYYLAIAEQTAGGNQAQQTMRLAQLEEEYSNFRIALRWSCAEHHPQLSLRLCIALWPFWETQGYLSEGCDWLKTALTELPPASDTPEITPLQARCRQALGALYLLLAQYDAAWHELEAAYEMFSGAGDRVHLGITSGLIGDLKRFQGTYTSANEWYQQQYSLALENNQPDQRAKALIGIGAISHERGDFSEALATWQQALTVLPATSDRLTGLTMNDLGIAYLRLGAYQSAFPPLCRAIQIAAHHRFRIDLGRATGNLGTLYITYGQLGHARLCIQSSLAFAIEVGHVQIIGWAMCWLAKVLADTEDLTNATEFMDRGIALLRSLETPYYLWSALTRQAELYQKQGQLLEAALALRETLQLARTHGFDITRSRWEYLQLMQLEVTLGQRDPINAIWEAEQLCLEWSEPEQQAVLYDTLWSLDPTRQDARQRAAELYATLHTTRPDILYRQRYRALTGQALLAPSPLPDPPAIVLQDRPSLAALLAAVDQR